MMPFSRKPENSRGSILVGVVVFSAILAVAGASLLLLANHTSNQTNQFVDEDRYHRAAENALTLALARLNNTRGSAPVADPDLQIGDPSNNIGGHSAVNGLPVQVSLSNVGGDQVLTSKAFVEVDANNPIRFTKSITCRVVRIGNDPTTYRLSFLSWAESTKTVTYP